MIDLYANLTTALAHLPVNDIAADVAHDFLVGAVPIVTSEVASGKTLLIPVACAKLMSDPIYVLQPTRFLANNAVDSLRSLIGPDGDELIGCLNSSRSDDESSVHKKNQIIVTTVGYALSAGIISTAKNIIFDEAHEASIDLSLAKALVMKRRQSGETVNVAILSATLDLDNEMEFWGEHARHHSTKGSAHPVEKLHRPAWSLAESVKHLVTEEKKTGVLVFVAGKEEINEAIDEITFTLGLHGLVMDEDFEIYPIHGESNGQQRRSASSKPTCPIKILIGTNVLESGVSLTWVDSGVSSGRTKVLHVRENIHRLELEELPGWRIEQQAGRTGRFGPGTYILADHTGIEYRPKMAAPDIVRLPLTELVMHCAKLPDVRIEELAFSKKERPMPLAIRQAIDTLIDYELIVEHEDGTLTMSEDGNLIENLPVSYRAAAAYCESVRLNAVATMIPLIALLDVGDLRQDKRLELSVRKWVNSDPISQVYAVAQLLREKSDMGGSLRDLCEYYNISMTKYREFTKLISVLEERLGVRANYLTYLTDQPDIKKELDQVAKQVIFRSMIRERYRYNWIHRDVNIRRIGKSSLGSYGFERAKVSNTSVCNGFGSGRGHFVTGNIRTIKPKFGVPFEVVEMVTLFGDDDLDYLKDRFGPTTVDPSGVFITKEEQERLDRLRREDEIYAPTRRTLRDSFDSTPRRPLSYSNHILQREPVEVKPAEPTVGSFGSALQDAFAKKK